MSGAQYPSLGFDPARGDVGAVRGVAKTMTDTSKYAKEAHELLLSIENQRDVWTGEAARLFADQLVELPKYLDDAH